MVYLTYRYLHIVAVIAWMAGILYLYRLFIYHAETQVSEKKQDVKDGIHELLCTMERRLYRYITLPAMILAVLFASGVLYVMPTLMLFQWLWVKASAGLLLVIATLYGGHLVKSFAERRPHPTSKALRFLNEVPTILMLIIVAMVIFRP